MEGECPECGRELSGEETFCPGCGHDLTSAQPSACPECDQELSGDERYCPGCGHDLDTDQPSATSSPASTGSQGTTLGANKDDGGIVSRRQALAVVGAGLLGGGGVLAAMQLTGGDDQPKPAHTGTASPTAAQVTDAGSETSTSGGQTSTETETTFGVAGIEGHWPMSQYDRKNSGVAPSAVGPQDGAELLWRTELDGTEVNSQPILVDETIFVGNGAWNGAGSDVYAIGPSDGSIRWSGATDDSVTGEPAVADETVVAGSWDGVVYAFQKSDGSERWRFDTGSACIGAPTVVDGTVYIGNEAGTLYALDITDGTSVWQFKANGRVRSPPVVVDDAVYIGDWNGDMHAISIDDGAREWSVSVTDAKARQQSFLNGYLYVATREAGEVVALEPTDGSEQWRFSDDQLGAVTQKFAVMENTLYFVGHSNSAYLYALNITDASMRWRFEIGGSRQGSAPTVADSVVYVGSRNETVYAVDAGTGTELWRFDAEGQVTSSPVAKDGVLYFGNKDGDFYAITDG